MGVGASRNDSRFPALRTPPRYLPRLEAHLDLASRLLKCAPPTHPKANLAHTLIPTRTLTLTLARTLIPTRILALILHPHTRLNPNPNLAQMCAAPHPHPRPYPHSNPLTLTLTRCVPLRTSPLPEP